MPELPDHDPRIPSEGVLDGAADWFRFPLQPSPEELALIAELTEHDRLDREAGRLDHLDFDAPPPWDEAVVTDDQLVAGLDREVHAADLMLLASIDPRDLSENLVRVEYLRALDRIAARVASMRHAAVVAMVGRRSSEAYLPEVALEHELSVARRTSRYAAGKAIEVARALATTFPGFAAALRAGEVTDAHCSILVEKTRVVADETALAEIERRVLPKAKRLTPGEFAGEVAKTIARLDRDAAARVKKARATRRVWARQLDDGMGYLGLTHDWSTIQAIHDAVATDGRCLQVARGGSGSVAEGNEDAVADACRADAMAARILRTLNDDGSVSYDRANVGVTVNVVMDLPTLRGEATRSPSSTANPSPPRSGARSPSSAPGGGAWSPTRSTGTCSTTAAPPTCRRSSAASCSPVTGSAAHRVARPRRRHGCRWTTSTSSLRDRAPRRTAGRCARPATSSRPPASPTSPTPTLGPRCCARSGEHSSRGGSCRWITAWGQSIHVPPRSVLPIEPDPPPVEAEPPTPDDPPPF